MKRNESRRLAEALARDVDGQSAELPAGLKQVTGSLQQAVRETQPRPGFVNELAQQLQQKQESLSQERQGRRLLPGLTRLLIGAAGAVAVIALIFFAIGLFSQPAVEPPISELQTSLPPAALLADGGMFSGIEFRLQEPLSEEAEQLPLYEAEMAPLPDSAEAVRELAVGLGMESPEVYRVAGQAHTWLARDEAGRRLTVAGMAPLFPIRYSAPDEIATGQGGLDAITRAVAFLDSAGLLPAEYETRIRPDDTGEDRQLVEIIPTLNGRPVHYASSEVVLGPGGGVVEARFQPLTFSATGEIVTAQPGQQAFQQVLHEGVTMDATSQAADGIGMKSYYPSLAETEVGDEVRLLGFVTVLEPVDGETARVALSAGPLESSFFYLAGPMAGQLVGQELVAVTGTLIESQLGGGPTVEVSEWWAPSSDGQPLECKIGTLHHEGEQVVLLTDERAPFTLADPPRALLGQRVEVCALFAEDTGELPWLSITSPPTREISPGGGRTVRVEEVEGIEVTRVIVQESGRVTEQVEEAGGATRSETEVVDLNVEDAASPFEIGQEVEVTGVVGGFLRREGEQIVPYIHLSVDTDDDPATPPVSYPLTGPWGLLVEISRQYRLHVTVPGTIVAAEGKRPGPEGQAIEVGEGGWWRTWPDEAVEAFLGHFEVATLEGRELRLFVDQATGQRFVDATPLYYAQPGDSLLADEDADSRVWLAGVAHPEAAFAGLPILTILEQRSGGGIEQLDNPDELPLQVEMALYGAEPLRTSVLGSSTLIIDWAVLGYTYYPAGPGAGEASPLRATWLFYGHTPDNLTQFVLRVPAEAAAEQPVEVTRVAP